MTVPFPESPGPAARLAAWLYGLGVALHAGGARGARALAPVISVGNLAVGGTGKTPAVIWLARAMAARGHRPAVLTRGYGRRLRRPVLLGPGAGKADLAAAGDEPLEMARALPDRPILIDADRRASAARAVRECQADLLILDDGFQHRALARDLDIVLLDADRPFGNGHLLPAGPLREPVAALHRAAVILLTRASMARDLDASLRRVRSAAPGAWVGLADHRAAGLTAMEDWLAGRPSGKAPAGGPLLAVAGIADPQRLRQSLVIDLAVSSPVEIVAYPDHQSFGASDLEWLRRRAEGRRIVTTAKDAVRWREVPGFGDGEGWWVLEIVFTPREPEELLARIAAAIS